MLIIVVSWNRPHFLLPTMESIFANKSKDDEVIIVDNGSGPETLEIVKKYRNICLSKNMGINVAYEIVLDECLKDHEFILTSDADMRYLVPFSFGEDRLRRSNFDVFSFFDSPEHECYWNNGEFKGKSVERGCSLLLKREFLDRVRPLPKDKIIDYDWWLFRDCVNYTNKIMVYNGAEHLGEYESTWRF